MRCPFEGGAVDRTERLTGTWKLFGNRVPVQLDGDWLVSELERVPDGRLVIDGLSFTRG